MKRSLVVWFLAILGLLIFLINFRYEKKQYYSDNIIRKEFYVTLFGKIDGEVKEYYDNGQISLSSTFNNGIQEGETKEYFRNGLLSARYKLKGGHFIDSSFFYHRNGQLKEIKNYLNQTLLRYDTLGRMTQSGKLNNESFTGWQITYKGNEWDQFNYIIGDKPSLVTQNGEDGGFLYYLSEGFQLQFPPNFHISIDEDDSVGFAFRGYNNAIDLNVLVLSDSVLYQEFSERIVDRDSTIYDVIKDSHIQGSEAAFYQKNERIYIDILVKSNDRSFWISYSIREESYEKNREYFVNLAQTFSFVEFDL